MAAMTSLARAAGVDLLEDGPPSCCGSPAECQHTILDLEGHEGYLHGGRMFCRITDTGPLIQATLCSDAPQQCALVPLREQQVGHVHGPGCGHEAVPHDGHIDYLVGDELHHVLAGPCCPTGCLGDASGAVVSHGRVSVLRRRRGGASPGTPAALPPLEHMLDDDSAPSSPCQGRGQADVEMGDAGSAAAHIAGTPTGSGPLTTTKVYAGGICCPMEVPLIERLLKPLPGVVQVEVAVIMQTVSVLHDSRTSAAALAAALNAAALDASLQPPRQQVKLMRAWIPPAHLLVAAALLLVSCLHYLAKPTGKLALEHLKWLAIASVAIGLPVILLRAVAGLRRGLLDINILMTVAVAGAIAIGDYTEAAAVVVLFGLAEWLETRAAGRARDAIAAVLALNPDTAVLAATGEEVSAVDVPLGARVLVAPGQRVPADGVVAAGASAADESMLTGEAAPVDKGLGDAVLGGTVNVGDAALEVETTATAESSTVARLGRTVEAAAAQRSPLEGAVARFAKYYTPVVLVAALLIAFVPWATNSSKSHKHWVYLALQILVTACPCALVLSTPVAVVCAIATAARAGVLIRGGPALEDLGRAKAVLFDKTGTLTAGRCQVVHLEAYAGFPVPDVLMSAAGAERGSAHPLAAALVGAAAAAAADTGLPAANMRSLQGKGVLALVGGRAVAVGNSRLLAGQGVRLTEEQVAEEAAWQAKGATVVWIAIDYTAAGLAAVADQPRAGAAAAVSAIQRLGLRTAMLTGDCAGAAAAVAAAVALQPADVHAGLLPDDKLAKVAQYRKECRGPVVVVGDGVNDAPALAAADVGIAMGARGADAALEAAPVALFSEELDALPGVLRLGRYTRRTIHINIAGSVLTKVAVLVLAAMGKFTLWGAVLVDVGTALAVIANSLLLLRKRLRPGGRRSGGGGSCVTKLAAAKAADGGQDGGCQDGSCCADARSSGRSNQGDDCRSTCCSSRSPVSTKTLAPCLDNSCEPGCTSCPVPVETEAAVQAGSGCGSSKRCGSSSTCCPASAATAAAASTATGCCKSSSCGGAVAAMEAAVDADAPAQVAAAPCCRRSGRCGGDAQS